MCSTICCAFATSTGGRTCASRTRKILFTSFIENGTLLPDGRKRETMKLINLTSRTIRVYDEEGVNVLYELPTSPPAISVDVTAEVLRTIGNSDVVPAVRHQFRLTNELPTEKKNTVYVVGWAVLQAILEGGLIRDDLVAPDPSRGSAVRDNHGQIVGVKRFRVM